MHRPVCALLLAVSVGGIAVACGTVTDENAANGRPLELEFVTAQIFAPSCGQTQCHSKFHQAGGLVFDNPHDVRASLLTTGGGPAADALLQFHSDQYDPLLEVKPNLIAWLTETFPLGKADNSRMPFDAPLPERDIQLLTVWIRSPLDANGDPTGLPGASASGAQCNPDAFGGFACNYLDKVKCNPDWNFGAVEESCSDCKYPEIDDKLTLECTPL